MKRLKLICSLLLAASMVIGLGSCKKENVLKPQEPLPPVISWNGSERSVVAAAYCFNNLTLKTMFRLRSSTRSIVSDPEQYLIDIEIPNHWLNETTGITLNTSSDWKVRVYAAGTDIRIPAAAGTEKAPAVVSGSFYAIGGSAGFFKMRVLSTVRVYDTSAGHYVPVTLNFSFEGTMVWDESLDTYDPEDPDL